jgi:hypothetical protein
VPSRAIEKIVPNVVVLPAEFVPPAVVVPYSLPSCPSSSSPVGCAPLAPSKLCSTVNTLPTGSSANTVPTPLLPPWLVTPYRRPSRPSVSPAAGPAPSTLVGGVVVLVTSAGSVRSSSKPVPSRRTRKMVPLPVVPPRDAVP